MKIGIAVFVSIFLLLSIVALLYLQTMSEIMPLTSPSPSTMSEQNTEEFTPFTASFEITTNGTKRVFTSSMYHNLSEDVYITNITPEVIHVERDGIKWKEFFDSLPMKLSEECLTTGTGQVFCDDEEHDLMFILNGENIPDTLNKEIMPNDQLEVVYK